MSIPEVRPATADDLAGVVASSAALFAEDAGQRDRFRNPDWPAAHGEKWCAELLADPDAQVFVAVADGEIVGHLVGIYAPPSAMWLVARAELMSMFVRETSRGRGVGGRLVDAFAEWAKQRGAVRLHVTAYAARLRARFDSGGRPSAHTQHGAVGVARAQTLRSTWSKYSRRLRGSLSVRGRLGSWPVTGW
ncbi:GNAT family N-acetyltransferase [Kribbella catacumbae]|uniref:GNAT family N-acetyltransferase n=1 Tax=Kribbella catacumbae TaxID=460086 RepID=UPI000A02E185|nr:GNAT family N-acetyltransferase [Kribbella catacumbae]